MALLARSLSDAKALQLRPDIEGSAPGLPSGGWLPNTACATTSIPCATVSFELDSSSSSHPSPPLLLAT